jgi:hypothetical protein
MTFTSQTFIDPRYVFHGSVAAISSHLASACWRRRLICDDV